MSEHNILLSNKILSLGPREAPVPAGFPITDVLSILSYAGDDTLWAIRTISDYESYLTL